MRRNVNKHASFRRKEQQEALVKTAAPEVLTAIQKTAAEAVGTAAAALAIAEGAQKVATAAAVAAARRISDVAGGRRNRKQAQAVWVKQDAEKEERKRLKSKAHKDATLAFKAEMEKPRGERQSSAQVCKRVSEQHKLSPNSELKPKTIKAAVGQGKWRCSSRGRPASNARPPSRRRRGPGALRRRP
jgi:hypothetical protein